MAKPSAPATASSAAAVPIEPAGFFALRTPLLPFDELLAFGAGLEAAGAATEDLARALSDDRGKLRERLRAIVTRPEVIEALFIASPSLEESMPAWLEAPESERGQKVERSLVRYFTRMAARATPFGLFAGCSVGTLGAATDLRIGGRDGYRRHTRLDGDYLQVLSDALQSDPELRRTLVFRPNSSLYRVGARLRYVEGKQSDATRTRSYRLIDVESDEPLEATLQRAAAGAHLEPLAQALVDGDRDGDITPGDAAEFIDQLVDAQLLVAELAPRVTGPEPIHELIAQLTTGAPPIAALLGEVRDELQTLDDAPPGASPARYRRIAERLSTLPADAELKRLFQVDLVKPAPAATLGAEPVAELTRVIQLLRRLLPRPRNAPLQRFVDAFSTRYEGRQVPLSEVLDEEHGIGFERSDAPSSDGSPLLEGLLFVGETDEWSPPLGPLGRLLMQKLDDATRDGADEIVLDESELLPLVRADAPPLPVSFSAMANLSAAGDEAMARGDYRWWLQHVNGPSGANLLGRFCHGDEDLTARVRRHLDDEERQRPDAIFAEIVHLPEGRTGNILLRPLLRRHEISFLGRSGAPFEQQILLDDLLLSVEAGRITLRSRRLGREVIPRLTSAHGFGSPRNLGVYRFLCALQQQDGEVMHFDWGALESRRHLPRLRIGKVILRPRRWQLDEKDLAPLAAAKSAVERFASAQALRAAHRLPRFVAVVDGDNVLPIDLDNSLSVDTFVAMVKERPLLKLDELFAPDALCARGPEGSFVNELVIPMLARRPSPPSRASLPPPRSARSMPFGSEWLYAKLYCGEGTADRLLRDSVAPLVNELRAAGLVDNWFFLRYGDPDFHLRLRFHGAPETLSQKVAPRLAEAFAGDLAHGLVWKLQLDSYERELERYGGDACMTLCEQIFGADSDAALAIVATLEGAAGAEARWRLTLRGIDQLLDDLGLTLDEKLALMTLSRDGFAREHRADVTLERQLGERYRKERLALETLLDRGQDAGSDYEPGFAALAARSTALEPLAAELRAHIAAGRATVTLPELAGSLVHMFANRVFRGAARAQELVVYDFLSRLYQGRAARLKKRR